MSDHCGVAGFPLRPSRSCCCFMNKRATNGEAYEPTFAEHVANVASHAIAIPISIIATSYLLSASQYALQYNVAFLYGFSGTLLFLSSTAYHSSELLFRPHRKILRYYLHILDRATIYFFIAASYTPWVTLRECTNVLIDVKIVIWLLALAGIIYQCNFHERFKTAETVFYIALGTGPSFATLTMTDRSGLSLMAMGGLAYLAGVVFFKLDGIVPFAHAIWHLHVFLGAATQCYAVHSILLAPSARVSVDDDGSIKSVV